MCSVVLRCAQGWLRWPRGCSVLLKGAQGGPGQAQARAIWLRGAQVPLKCRSSAAQVLLKRCAAPRWPIRRYRIHRTVRNRIHRTSLAVAAAACLLNCRPNWNRHRHYLVSPSAEKATRTTYPSCSDKSPYLAKRYGAIQLALTLVSNSLKHYCAGF